MRTADGARLTLDRARQQLTLQVVETFYRALLHGRLLVHDLIHCRSEEVLYLGALAGQPKRCVDVMGVRQALAELAEHRVRLDARVGSPRLARHRHRVRDSDGKLGVERD